MPRSADRPAPRPHHPLRTRFSRAAVPYWLGVAALALTTAFVVATIVGRAAASEARYGRTRAVLVATRAIAPGDAIDGDSVALVRWPVTLLPSDALTAVPPDRVATADIADGEVVISGRVSGGSGRGAATLVPPGARALAVPLLVPGLPLRPGDRVDLLATAGGGDPAGFSDDAAPSASRPARPVAADALVVAVDDQAVTVAIEADDAAAVAVALTSGTVVVALAGPPG